MKERFLIGLAGLLCLLSCGPRKSATPAPADRPFPVVDVPAMMEEPQQRASWLALHFWDRFMAPDSLYRCDSLHINGVSAEEVEKQLGIFATILVQNMAPNGPEAMTRLFRQAESFQQAHPDGNLFPRMNELVIKYFYDPNSPLRDERLYLPYAQGLAGSDLIDPTLRQRYAWEASLCALNAPGTKASDFTFIDTAGRRRSLYGVKADLTLLIFGNPYCQACRELQAVMEGDEGLSAAIESGQLKVVDIYIDEDIEAWKRQKADYPASWINGYDPAQIIRTDLLYNVRALPSLYLLDADKTVLLKDCTPGQFFAALGL